MRQLEDDILKWGNAGNVEKMLLTGYALIKIFEELGHSQRMVARTYYDMYQLAISKEKYYKRAVELIKLSYQNCWAYFGYDCEEVRDRASYAGDPKSHCNYLMSD